MIQPWLLFPKRQSSCNQIPTASSLLSHQTMLLSAALLLPLAGLASAGRKRPQGCHPTPTLSPSSSSSSSSSSTSSVTTLPASCTFRPTQTIYPASGCSITCRRDFCISDALVTVSCGCPSLVIKTQTTTVCATQSPCWQCSVAWGNFRITPSCPPTPTQTAPARTTY
ncbi:hypothetical protein VTJ83DRAFT_2727 [Remersonia thermophila]|uniref:Uncharacterized protein n=1 Tax=Remersonia thermophila TaxID=72144 RepID=A0ABR4DJM1_9PEZI